MSRCAQQFKGQMHKAHKESRKRHPKGKLPFFVLLLLLNWCTCLLVFWGFFGICILGWLCLCCWIYISFSASSHLHLTVGELERIGFLAFSCSCSAWMGSLCWYHLQSRGSRGSRAQHHHTHWVLLTGSFWPGGSTGCWDSAHFLHVVWLNDPVVLLPASAAFQGILRKKKL